MENRGDGRSFAEVVIPFNQQKEQNGAQKKQEPMPKQRETKKCFQCF